MKPLHTILTLNALLGVLCLPAAQADVGDKAQAEVAQQYRQQVAACATQSGERRLVCLDEATLDRTIALEDLRAESENTAAARARAARNKVEAAFVMAEGQCARGATAQRSACLQRAKAQRDVSEGDIAANQAAFVSYDALAAGEDDGLLRRAALSCDKLRDEARDRCVKQFVHQQQM
ncbi:hypothetical protein [Chitiniphilus eburneus]|uniref:DUF1311 domain-containing protein n=1 Tax=Chitiniphilus eburneus TaxID=2571148 RepID=A0A4U0QAV3_9NEIS|nr:hypothetical protein [Chitiniphilus eburneus]TJZ72954.1 hypothetical protein FAZ21_12100 [Chitiniphilus eburneus]